MCNQQSLLFHEQLGEGSQNKIVQYAMSFYNRNLVSVFFISTLL